MATSTMKTIDLTGSLERKKHSRILHFTVYLNGQYFGFKGSGKMGTGISFVKSTSKGVNTNRAGRTIWWFSVEDVLTKAIAKVRRIYAVKVPVHGWEKVRIKAFNNSDTAEIIQAIKDLR